MDNWCELKERSSINGFKEKGVIYDIKWNKENRNFC